MYYVYILKSIEFKNQIYIGFTRDVVKRIDCHNSGGSNHTAKYRPWKLVVSLTFLSKKRAIEFERYLKTQSGRAFAKKRFF